MPVPRLRHNRYQDTSGSVRPHDGRHHAEDLREFHLPLARLQQAGVHLAGVLQGLQVHATPDGSGLTVEAGVAVDGTGRLVVLGSDGRADVGADPAGGDHEERPVPVALPLPASAGLHYVTVQFNELLRPNEGAGGRLEQAPWLRVQPVTGRQEDDGSVVLAVVELAGGGAEPPGPRVQALGPALPGGPAERRAAGTRVGELALAHGAGRPDEPVGPDGTRTVGEAVAGRIRAGGSGGLALTVSGAVDAITLAAEGGGRFARFDVRADEMVATGNTQVAGDLTVLGGLGVDRAVTVADDLTVSAALTVGGPASVAGGLTVSPSLAVEGGATVGADLAVTGTLAVDGPATIAGGLTGTDLHADGALTVTGAATVGGAVTAGELRSAGVLHADGGAVVRGDLEVDHLRTPRATVAALTADRLRATGTLRVDGVLDVRGELLTAPSRVTLVPEGGRVGVGTTEPRNELHVLGRIASGQDFRSGGAITFYPPDGFAWFHIDNGPANRATGRLRISHGGAPGAQEIVSILQNGRVGIGTTGPDVTLHVSGNRIRLSRPDAPSRFVELRTDGSALDLESRGGDLFINNHGQHATRIRNLVQVSSRRTKERIAVLPGAQAGDLLDRLEPVTFRYRDDPGTVRVGFVAEDLPPLVTTTDREGFRPSDVLAVLTAVVRAQRADLASLRAELTAFRARPVGDGPHPD